MNAPRVLVVGTVLGLGPSGVARQAREILPRAAARLAAEGGTLGLLVGRQEPDFVRDCATWPGETAPWEVFQSDVPAGPAARRWLGEGRALRGVLARAQAAGAPFQVVHQGHLPLHPRRSERFGARSVWLLHDLRRVDPERSGPLGARLGRIAIRRAARSAHLALTVSEPVRDELLALHPGLVGRVRVVPNGWDHLALAPRAPGDFLLGVGHLEARKGWETLIEALGSDPALPRLVLVGRGPERRRLEGLGAAAIAAGRLEFAGAVGDDELVRLYARARLLVVPSLLEGFSIPALEGLAAGVPLVLSDLAVHRALAGPFAHYAPPGDAAALGAALTAALGAGPPPPAARERALGYTWDAAADALVRAWCEAARGA